MDTADQITEPQATTTGDPAPHEPFTIIDGKPANPAAEWAVIEIFGHRRHAGAILEVERFGSKLLRIDIPKTGDDGEADYKHGFESHFYGGAAIFSMTLTDLPSVLAANKRWVPAARKSLPKPDEDPYDAPPDDDDDDDRPF